jgi:hypothetical protein
MFTPRNLNQKTGLLPGGHVHQADSGLYHNRLNSAQLHDWSGKKKDEKKETEDPTKGGIVCLDLPQSLLVWQVIKSGKASVHCIPSRSSIFRII